MAFSKNIRLSILLIIAAFPHRGNVFRKLFFKFFHPAEEKVSRPFRRKKEAEMTSSASLFGLSEPLEQGFLKFRHPLDDQIRLKPGFHIAFPGGFPREDQNGGKSRIRRSL